MQANHIFISEPPRTFKEKFKLLGPGFLWMVSAAGSGELLFTPRIGALYGYTLLWAMIAAVALKWSINREIGRYAVCTGRSVIDGFADLPGPKNWAIFVILVPQLFVAVTSIAGLAGSAATALVIALPGNIKMWTIIAICVSTALVVWGQFKSIERVATVLAIALGVASVIAAISVFPHGDKLAAGMIPHITNEIKYEEVLPWLGFMLSGAAGLIWYSYWVREKGYGMKSNSAPANTRQFTKADLGKLKKWIQQMTWDTTVAVAGTLIVTLSFLILGTELLMPKGLVPEENKVAETLGNMLAHLWGPVGFWFMITAVFVGFWDTVLSDQDGFGRMFSGGTRLLMKNSRRKAKWATEKNLQRIYVIVLVTIAPIVLYLILGEPIRLLKIAGAIEACHIPLVVTLVLFLNHKELPEELRPSRFSFLLTVIAGVFFLVFAAIYVLQLAGVSIF
jgi:Mn2+/Fe2+ NRAMP family transporter